MYIWEELGRWPTWHNQVATLTYSWDLGRFIVLFIPTRFLVDKEDLEAGWVETHWEHVDRVQDRVDRMLRPTRAKPTSITVHRIIGSTEITKG